MSLDAELHDILREHERDLLPLARKVYEHGFRQGLAARPGAPVAVDPPAPPSPPAPGPPQARSEPLFAESAPHDEPDEPDNEEVEEDDPADVTRPVRSSITVGGLLKKMNRHFGLGRFDIEIRIVDPRSHRHLMRGVRLSRYLVEEA